MSVIGILMVFLVILVLLLIVMVDKIVFDDLICCGKYENEFLWLYCEICYIFVCSECIFYEY